MWLMSVACIPHWSCQWHSALKSSDGRIWELKPTHPHSLPNSSVPVLILFQHHGKKLLFMKKYEFSWKSMVALYISLTRCCAGISILLIRVAMDNKGLPLFPSFFWWSNTSRDTHQKATGNPTALTSGHQAGSWAGGGSCRFLLPKPSSWAWAESTDANPTQWLRKLSALGQPVQQESWAHNLRESCSLAPGNCGPAGQQTQHCQIVRV